MSQMITKPDGIRELGPVNITPVKSLVDRLSEKVWALEDERKENNFFCFHHTQHIISRFIEANRDHKTFYSTPIWSVWQKTLLPIMEQVVAAYDYSQPTYPKVMLARLQAGNVIDRHVDGRGANLYTHKIHIPLQTNKHAEFIINDVSYYLQEGHAYEVNNMVAHAVENLGETDRIHIIFELFDNDQHAS